MALAPLQTARMIGLGGDVPVRTGGDQSHGGQEVLLADVEKWYGSAAGVRQLSMHLRAGEFVTLLGPSGSGKTTTLMMIAGFVEPDRGSIRIGIRDVTRLPPQHRGIGVVFQQYLLFPHMTVAQNIAFPLAVRGVKRQEIRRQVLEIMDLVGLEGLGERRPHQLSGGQQQRVALSRALVYRPPVLLMDEPLGALDKKLRDQLQTEIKRIQRQLGLTVVYVTHDQEEALVLSDRIGLMRDGSLEQLAPPPELFDRPASKFVADFLGNSNFLRGTVSNIERDCALVQLEEGGRLLARRSEIATGERVSAAIQPGRLRICEPGSGFVEAEVLDATYVGSITRVLVCVVASAARLRIDIPGTSTPPIGSKVGVAVLPEDVALFHEDEHKMETE